MNNPNCGVYTITCIKTQRVYVGQSSQINGRFRRHKRDLRIGRHGNSYLQASWNKYGEESFIFSVAEYCALENLTSIEQSTLNYFRDNGFPVFNFGECVDNPNRGRKWSAESIKKRSEKMIGRPSHKRGTKSSRESVEKMRKALLGRVFSPEHKAKISIAMKGKKLSLEHRLHLSESAKGKKAHNKGKKHTEESRRKMSESSKGRKAHNRCAITCVATGEKFSSITDAAKAHGMDISSLAKLIKKKTCSAWAIRDMEDNK